jgi:acyl dehydratase
MTAADAVQIGQRYAATARPITRADLIRYAGASEDFNPIHWSDRAARAVGLPGVIAHGMLTMARTLAVLTDWLGDPGRLVACETRFARPLVVPDDDHGVTLAVTIEVVAIDADGVAKVRLTASSAGHPASDGVGGQPPGDGVGGRQAAAGGQDLLAHAYAWFRPPL